jgi:hypothetical protein
MMRALAVVLALVVAAGCGVKKPAAVPLPVWASARPQLPGYYIGIASASKDQHPYDAMDAAKKRALADLATEIRVRVESNSALQTSQHNDLVSQQFRQNISSTSAENLEGYELVGSHEDGNEAWAYYRLSRATWERILAERRAAAAAVAGGFYTSGLSARSARDAVAAVDRCYRCLAALAPFAGESVVWRDAGGAEVALDRACLDAVTSLLAGVALKPAASAVELVPAAGYRGSLDVQVFLDGAAAPNFPVVARYHRGTLPRRVELTTDANGVVAVPLDGFDPGTRATELRIAVDLERLLPRAGGGVDVPALRNLPPPEVTVPVRLVAPTVAIASTERAFGRPVRAPALTEALRAALSERGCTLTEDVRTADLRISIDADTREAGSGSGFFTATLDATIVIRGADNAVVLQRNLDRVKGVQLNFEAASAEAYRKAGQELRGSFSDELLKSLYR